MGEYTILIYALILLNVGAKFFLEYLNRNKIRLALLSDNRSNENYTKSLHYTKAKSSLQLAEIFFDGGLLFLIFYFFLFAEIYAFFQGGLWSQVGFVLSCLIGHSVLKLGFSYYKNFYIESRYGFNNSTVKLWVTDQIKGGLLAVLIGGLVFLGIFYLIEAVAYWWVWGIFLMFGFQLLMMVLVPIFIMPLFNKYEPLEDGDLKSRLLALAQRTGFGCQSIQKVDGSKRSNHSNAYFTGFGKFRKIVLFDTLIKQMSDEELEAVLAHEIGHYKLGHIPKSIFISFFSMALLFGLIAFLLKSAEAYTLFGFSENIVGQPAPLFVILMFYGGLVTFWWSPIVNSLSRSWEYQADNFAKKVCGDGRFLISALENLSRENLSNPIPHRLYSFFYYSHPVLIERTQALKVNC